MRIVVRKVYSWQVERTSIVAAERQIRWRRQSTSIALPPTRQTAIEAFQRTREEMPLRRSNEASARSTVAVRIASARTSRCSQDVAGRMRLPYAAADIVDAIRIVFKAEPSPPKVELESR